MTRKLFLSAVSAWLMVALACVASAQDVNVQGTWELSRPGRGGQTMTQMVTLQQDGQKLAGTIRGIRGGGNPIAGTISGNNINLTMTRKSRRGAFSTNYVGTVNGDTMSGTITMRRNTINWTARRSGGGQQ